MCFKVCLFLLKCNFFVNDLKKNIACLFCGEYFVLSGTDINIMDFDYMENYHLGVSIRNSGDVSSHYGNEDKKDKTKKKEKKLLKEFTRTYEKKKNDDAQEL